VSAAPHIGAHALFQLDLDLAVLWCLQKVRDAVSQRLGHD